MPGLAKRPWIWVTRAEPGASATAVRLKSLGFTPIVAPMIVTEPIVAIAPPPCDYDALAFTSVTAVQRFAALCQPPRDHTVFTVGDATGLAAKEQGWTNVISADGDVLALGAVLTQSARGMRVLHPCAETPAGDLAKASTGVGIIPLPVYATLPSTAWPKSVQDALAGSHGSVMVHSPSAARAIAALPQLCSHAPRLRVFALSAACATPFDAACFREIIVAPFPREAALLKVLSETDGL